ncbi:helix-turn-helix domain-containing protein [Leifsonia sp. McL0607]|uniref:helix-turn-helix domain-containing protein n=1 Tax=Leifsonia sp. McL0607 TaxID=3415672 RepID=UPI003CE66F9B
MAFADLLRAARKAAGFSQAEIADRADTYQPIVSGVERGKRDTGVASAAHLARAAQHRLLLIPTTHPSAVETAARIAASLHDGSRDGAFRALLDLSDGLANEAPLVVAALVVAQPESTGSPDWDDALSGTVAYRLRQAGLPPAAWTNQAITEDRELRAPHLHPLDDAPDVSRVPPEFLERGILIEEGTLASV